MVIDRYIIAVLPRQRINICAGDVAETQTASFYPPTDIRSVLT